MKLKRILISKAKLARMKRERAEEAKEDAFYLTYGTEAEAHRILSKRLNIIIH